MLHEAMPTITMGATRVTNGLPESPLHTPTPGLLVVHTVLLCTYRPEIPKRLTQFIRLIVPVFFHCKTSG